MSRARTVALSLATALALAGCTSSAHPIPKISPTVTTTGAATTAPASATRSPTSRSPVPGGIVPHWDHIVVVVEENKSSNEIVGSPDAPFLTALAGHGLRLTNSYAITHPSEPNYLALFSGSTHTVTSDDCPVQLSGPNLAAALRSSGHTFVGYSESLPRTGFAGCSYGPYARKHNPWVDFAALPASVNQPVTAFPADPSRLPDLAFLIPNLDDDMHDGTIAQADGWLSTHLGAYASWAGAHNSLLVVTTDEDDFSAGNHITTVLAGAQVRTGQYTPRVDHYGVLRTLLQSFGLPAFAGAAGAVAVTGVYS